MLRDQTGKFIQASIKAPGAAGVGGGESGIENKQQVALLAFWLWEVSCFLIRGERKQDSGARICSEGRTMQVGKKAAGKCVCGVGRGLVAGRVRKKKWLRERELSRRAPAREP